MHKIFDIMMMSSPEKMNGAELSKNLFSLPPAERAKMLKLRFAGLIAKANSNNPHQTKVILKINSLSQEANSKKRKRQETPQEEKKKREEEGELTISRKKQEIEAKRKAFRMELERIERSVEIVDNYKVIRDFEQLINAKPKPFF